MTIQLSSPQPTRISSISLFSSRFFVHSVFNACLSLSPIYVFSLCILCRLPIYLQRYFFLSHVLFSQIKTSDLLFGLDLCAATTPVSSIQLGSKMTFLYLSSSFSVYIFSLARSPPPTLSIERFSLCFLYFWTSIYQSPSLYLSLSVDLYFLCLIFCRSRHCLSFQSVSLWRKRAHICLSRRLSFSVDLLLCLWLQRFLSCYPSLASSSLTHSST